MYGHRVDDTPIELAGYLAEYTDEVRVLMGHALAFVDERLPGATRMVYVNWSATVVGHSADGRTRHSVCSVAAYPQWVNLYFFVGPDLPDPHQLLRGTGSTVRSVRLVEPADLDDRVGGLLDAAIAMWPWPFDSTRATTTTITSVSDKQRPRRR